MGKADEACDNARNKLCTNLAQDFFKYDRIQKEQKERMVFHAAAINREAKTMKSSGCPGTFTSPKW